MILPKQAVILCGGQGTRLRPYTFSRPKPMIDINSKPFLFHLLQQLADLGITDFLLLVGYKHEVILDFFKDGSEWGWSIKYHIGEDSRETGKRVLLSSHLLDHEFLLLYADNFVQHKLEELYFSFNSSNAPFAFHVAPKSSGNVQINSDNFASIYSSSGRSSDLPYVDLGYMIVRRDCLISYLEDYRDKNVSLSLIIEIICANHNVPIIIINDPYHSIGDVQRLLQMREYLSFKPHLLIDRDGIINYKAQRGRYITSWSDFAFIQDTLDAMKFLSDQGFYFSIITNQAGCATSDMTADELSFIHTRMLDYFSSLNISILDIFVSMDHWNSNSFMRKPNPGMFFDLSRKHLQRLDQTLYIGDDPRDIAAAKSAGCGSIFINSGLHDINYKYCKQFSSVSQSLSFINDFMVKKISIPAYFNS